MTSVGQSANRRRAPEISILSPTKYFTSFSIHYYEHEGLDCTSATSTTITPAECPVQTWPANLACQAHYVDSFHPSLTTDTGQEPGTTTDVFADHLIMNRLESSKDENIPIYIFLLLFSIFLLSFLATADLQTPPESDSTTQ